MKILIISKRPKRDFFFFFLKDKNRPDVNCDSCVNIFCLTQPVKECLFIFHIRTMKKKMYKCKKNAEILGKECAFFIFRFKFNDVKCKNVLAMYLNIYEQMNDELL